MKEVSNKRPRISDYTCMNYAEYSRNRKQIARLPSNAGTGEESEGLLIGTGFLLGGQNCSKIDDGMG